MNLQFVRITRARTIVLVRSDLQVMVLSVVIKMNVNLESMNVMKMLIVLTKEALMIVNVEVDIAAMV